jgi:hypothetical protein
MVEHHEAVIETNVAIGQLEIVDGMARQPRLDEVFQIIAPVTKATSKRKRKVNFIQQFAPRQKRVEDLPRITELDVMSDEG